MAPHHLPFYLAPGSGTDTLMVVMGVFLIGVVLWVGTLYWKLHSLPERMAHKSKKVQFEIVAVLGLISLFTHMHIFWVAGLLLAFIDFPDFGTPLGRIAGSVEKMAGIRTSDGNSESEATAADEDVTTVEAPPDIGRAEVAESKPPVQQKSHSQRAGTKERIHA